MLAKQVLFLLVLLMQVLPMQVLEGIILIWKLASASENPAIQWLLKSLESLILKSIFFPAATEYLGLANILLITWLNLLIVLSLPLIKLIVLIIPSFLDIINK